MSKSDYLTLSKKQDGKRKREIMCEMFTDKDALYYSYDTREFLSEAAKQIHFELNVSGQVNIIEISKYKEYSFKKLVRLLDFMRKTAK